MDIKELKSYIYENEYVEDILLSIGCHNIKYHASNQYWTCANATGDNKNAIVIYNNTLLICLNYTRQMVQSTRQTDIIDLVCYTKELSLPESLKFICHTIGISYYKDFNEEIPQSFKILKLIDDMKENHQNDKNDLKLQPISEHILDYYIPCVNQLFYEDNIDYYTQQEFEIGFDPESNRYTIPIRSEIGDLVGIKGRYFFRKVPQYEDKYIYLEPCSKSKILYGLNKTIQYINQTRVCYVLESEKSVMQLWSMGYRNSVATGGKIITESQINMLSRLGASIVICYDQDVTKKEVEDISLLFPEYVNSYYMYDMQNILEEHESPSDKPEKWMYLKKHNIYKTR